MNFIFDICNHSKGQLYRLPLNFDYTLSADNKYLTRDGTTGPKNSLRVIRNLVLNFQTNIQTFYHTLYYIKNY